MNDGSPPRRLLLCADDYGISPGVNRAIRDLIERGRINATSVMVVGPAVDHDEMASLKAAIANNPHFTARPFQLGLHTTLTAPFHPLTMHFRPLDGGLFFSLGATLRASLLRQLDPEIIHAEIASQLALFQEMFDRAPDYIDGHQHVQLFPQIRDAFIAAVRTAAPQAWVRQCGRYHRPWLTPPKAILLDLLSHRFRARCRRAGVAFNPAFAGAYDMVRQSDYSHAMSGFLEGLPNDGLIMCHPGFVDDTLVRIDNVLAQREKEYAFLASDAFTKMLAEKNLSLT